MLTLSFGQSTHPGKLRTSNEDCMGVSIPQSRGQVRSHGWMFVVADGVRGLGLGDVAASAAVRLMEREFFGSTPSGSLVATLRDLVRRANTAVHDETLRPERRGKRMATTVVACAVRADEAVVAHVGDSRLYQIRAGKVIFTTQDHTLVNEQHNLGRASSADESRLEMRHVVSRSLGIASSVEVDTATLPLRQGDVLVLCTDGVYKALYDEEIARMASQHKSMQQISEELVQYAVDVDGSDNATAQVVSVQTIETVGMYRGRRYQIAS